MKKVLTGIALAAVGSLQLSAQGQQYLQLTSPTGQLYILKAPTAMTSPIVLDLPTTTGTLVGTPPGMPLSPNRPVKTDADSNLISAAIDLSLSGTDVTNLLGTVNGGTGLDASAAANGALLIGNGSGFSLNTLTAGAGISVTNGSGSIEITSLSAMVDPGLLDDQTLRWDNTQMKWVTNPNVLADATGNLSVSGNGSFGGTLGVTGTSTLADVIANNQTLNGTLSVTGTVTLTGLSSSSDDTFIVQDGLGELHTRSITDIITGTGTTNYLPLWTGSNTQGTSIISQDGGATTATVEGSAVVNNDLSVRSITADNITSVNFRGGSSQGTNPVLTVENTTGNNLLRVSEQGGGASVQVGGPNIAGGVVIHNGQGANNATATIINAAGSTVNRQFTIPTVNAAGTFAIANGQGTSGQFLQSAGNGQRATWVTGNLVASGTTLNSTLRWDGSAWVENANVLANNVGDLGINGSLLVGINTNLLGKLTVADTSSLGVVMAGNTTINGTLTVTGTSTLADVNAANGTLSGTLMVTGTSTLGVVSAGNTTVNGTLDVTGTSTLAGVTATGLTVNGDATVTGTTTLNTALTGPLRATAGVVSSGNINLATEVSGVLPTTSGGTGSGVAPTAGQVLIGSAGSVYTPAFLTEGTGITITPAAGSITIALSGGTVPATAGLNSTLRFDGLNWVENANLLSDASGNTTVQGTLTLNNDLIANDDATFHSTTDNVTEVTIMGGSAQAATNILKIQNNGGSNLFRVSESGANAQIEIGSNAINGQLRIFNGASSGAASIVYDATATTNRTFTLPPVNGGAVLVAAQGQGTVGQFLISGGAGQRATWLTGSILPAGTTPNSTLRYNGASWVENTGVTADGVGGLQAATIAATNNLSAGGTLSITGASSLNGGVTVTGNASVSADLTVSGNTTLNTGLNGPLRASSGVVSTGNIDLTSEVTGTLPIANGGTGTTTAPADGQLLIGNSGSYSVATLTAGTGINITNAAGSITIENTSALVDAGSLDDQTLRWDGNLGRWVVNTNVLASASGELTVNDDINANANVQVTGGVYALDLSASNNLGVTGASTLGGTVTATTLAGASSGTAINTAANEGIVVADNNGVLSKKSPLAALGMTVGTYTNAGSATATVQITGLTLSANAKIFITGVNTTVNPGFSAANYISQQDGTSFTVTFGGDLQNGESFNYLIVEP